jgi:hypothetical protein
MGLGIETVDGFLLAANAAGFQAFGAGPNQTFAVRASNGAAPIALDAVWGNLTTAGQATIRSNRLHDAVQGILLQLQAASTFVAADEYFDQALYSQDALTVGANFTAAPALNAIQHLGLQVVYTDLPGVQANLRTWAEVSPNIIEYVGVQTTPTSLAASGTWGAGVALNSTFDLLKANQPYAVLGYQVSSAAAVSVALQGPDTGNLLFGGPAPSNYVDTRGWFARQSMLSGSPYIPIINSANKASTLANVTTNAAATAVTITWLMARLSA